MSDKGMLGRFLKTIGQRGLTIRHDGGEKFSIVGPDKEKTPEVINACKAFKPALIEKYCPAALANSPANATDTTDFTGTPTHAQEVNDRFTAPQANPVTVALEICRECKAKVDAKEMRKAPNVLCAWEDRTAAHRGRCPYTS